MSTAPVKTLIDEQISELPEHMAVPDDRILMVFKGLTMPDALHQAHLASIENPAAWTERQFWCGVWTLKYEIRPFA